MADADLRALERAAAAGDGVAQHILARADRRTRFARPNVELNRLMIRLRNGGEGPADWGRLPTFGGEPPEDRTAVLSWDETRLLVGLTAADLRIVSRDTQWRPTLAEAWTRWAEVADESAASLETWYEADWHRQAWVVGERCSTACPPCDAVQAVDPTVDPRERLAAQDRTRRWAAAGNRCSHAADCPGCEWEAEHRD